MPAGFVCSGPATQPGPFGTNPKASSTDILEAVNVQTSGNTLLNGLSARIPFFLYCKYFPTDTRLYPDNSHQKPGEAPATWPQPSPSVWQHCQCNPEFAVPLLSENP